MNFSFLKYAYSEYGAPEYDFNLLDNKPIETPSSDSSKIVENALIGSAIAPASVLAAKKVPGKFLDAALLSEPKNKFDKKYQAAFDKILQKAPFTGRHKTPMGRTGKALLLSSLLGGTLAALNSKKETDINPNPPASSSINNENVKNILKTTGYTAGGGALGASIGTLLKTLLGSDSNLLPILLGLSGAGLGYGYSKGYGLDDVKNLVNNYLK